MMMSNNWGNLGERRVLSDHVRSNVRMPSHDLPFLFTKGTRFVEDVVANSYFAQVVERSSGSDEIALTIAKLELLTELSSKFRDPNGM
ncbi:MAG: hypothetical protein AUI15_19610 [Actinobacteria bacterium 13_2_20CM_2_66_6]|nr:MAG: hypothetical protein AUI15_19610 [Actinobacteria bacterium 13_2_20CM_2_66_6]